MCNNEALAPKGTYMKKLLAAAALVVGFFVALPATAFAAPAVDTYVHGKISAYDTSSGSLVSHPEMPGAEVKVTCNGQTKVTNSVLDGTYSVRFNYGNCPVDSHAEVVATLGDLSGRNMTGSGRINEVAGEGNAQVNVVMHNYTKVSGFVRTAQGHPAGNAQVSVTCSGTTKTVLTNGEGKYNATFKAAECQIGGPSVRAIAVSGDMSGTGSAPILDFTDGIATIDPIILDTPVAEVPEMGVITSIGAGIAGLGAFAWIRRRNQSQVGAQA